MEKKEKTAPALMTAPGPEECHNGDLIYTIVTEYSEITCRFNPEKIKSLLKEMIRDLFNKALTGKADALLTVPGSGARYLVEMKIDSVKGLAWGQGNEMEIQEEIDFYAEEAYRMFSAALEERLLHGPPNYIVETIAATVASRDKEGALLTRMGTAPFYEELTAALLQKFKAQWALPGPGRHEVTGKRKRAKLLAYYEVLYLIAKAQRNAGKLNNGKKRRVNKGLQEEARKAVTQVDPEVLAKVALGVSQGTSPGNIAWQIASRKYLSKGEDTEVEHSRRILTDACNERAARERIIDSQ